MARQNHKTEHSGAKKGRGAFYGPKRVAKKVSRKRRREMDRRRARPAVD